MRTVFSLHQAKRPENWRTGTAAGFISFLCLATPSQAEDVQKTLREMVLENGFVQVIIEQQKTADNAEFENQADILVAQSLQLDPGAPAIRSLGNGGAALATINMADYDRLVADKAIGLIAPVRSYLPALDDVPALINLNKDMVVANSSTVDVSTGDQSDPPTIVVIDTGVNQNHPFLSGKVVLEACFSEVHPDRGVTSLCPGGQNDDGLVTQLGPQSATSCNASISGCGHGTHVAGIIAGNSVVDPRDASIELHGVNPNARIVAIQVFSRYASPDDCVPSVPAPCAKTTDISLIQALDYVQYLELQRRLLKKGPRIVAVNMSLASGKRPVPCDNSSPLTRPISALLGLGIPTFIATGNHSNLFGVSEPACISEAISVAASTKLSKIWSKSDRTDNGMVDLVAPGVGIYSSTDGGGFGERSGTSMATGIASGSYSLLKHGHWGLGTANIINAMRSGFTPIEDEAGVGPFAGVNVGQSILLLDNVAEGGSVAAPANPIPPIGTDFILQVDPKAESYDAVLSEIKKKSGSLSKSLGDTNVTVRQLGDQTIVLETGAKLPVTEIEKSIQSVGIPGIDKVFQSKSHLPF